MDVELEEKLKKEFPILYSRSESDDSLFQYFGFECGNGWFEVIKKMSQKLEPLFKKQEQDGFYPAITQVKEKFGSLMVYGNNLTEEMNHVIYEAAKESQSVCENCGKPGTVRKRGYVQVLCDGCNSGLSNNPENQYGQELVY